MMNPYAFLIIYLLMFFAVTILMFWASLIKEEIPVKDFMKALLKFVFIGNSDKT